MALSRAAKFRAHLWMQDVTREVEALSVPSLQLVGALMTRESALPLSVRTWVISLLGQRIDMGTVSPAAEAVLRICEFKRYPDSPAAQSEVQAQMCLLRTLELVDALEEASIFVITLIARYIRYVTEDCETASREDSPLKA